MHVPSESTPVGKAIFDAGALAVLASAFLGVASLIYYGLTLSPPPSAFQNVNAGIWSQEVKTRILHTYAYYFLSFYAAVMFAYLTHSNPTLSVAFSSFGMILADFVVEIIIDSGKSFARMNRLGYPKTEKFIWMTYCAFLGGIASPSFSRDSTTLQIAIHTTFIVAFVLISLSLAAPVGKFTKWRTKLHIFEMIVMISAMCTNVVPGTSSLGALFISISFYGGLILCSLNILYHSQKSHLEASSENSETHYNSLAMSIPLLTNTLNIFHRIVVMIPLE